MGRGGEAVPRRFIGLLVFDIEVGGVAFPGQGGVVLVVIGDGKVVGFLTTVTSLN